MLDNLDNTMKEIQSLFQELDTVEKKKKQNNIPGKEQEYDKLRGQEINFYNNIKEKIKKLRKEVKDLEKFEDDKLLEILKKMEEFIRSYGEKSHELCAKLQKSEKEFLKENSSALKQLYQNIWNYCGFGNLK